MDDRNNNDIAIVGMAIRVPGAATPEQFWANLRGGVESVQTYTDEELLARGVSPRTLANPNYVRAGIPLEDVDQFDPEFFGFSPKEAAIIDPQHRQFFEVAWEALEHAGHPPKRFPGAIGVFAGCGMGAYFTFNLLSNPDLVDTVGLFLLRHTGNDKDFLATRVSYAFNLKGPSVNVQTACSTSLVATHLAVQSLLSGECDMALAGGVTIELPHGVGYLYQGRRDPVAGRALPHLRSPLAGHGLRQRRRRRRAAPARRRARRRRPHPRGHQGHRGQQRRLAQGRLSRAERRRPGRGDRRGAGGRRRFGRHDRLRRMPRHRHARRRPDRDRRTDARVSRDRRAAPASAASARSRPTSAISTRPPASRA